MKSLHLISYSILIFAYIALFYILYQMFYPFKPIEFYNSPFPVTNNVVKQGGQLIYFIDYCKYMNISSQVSRSFVDTIVYSLVPVSGAREKGCKKEYIVLKVPKNLPAGSYYVSVNLTYQLNSFRESYVVNYKTQNFEVVE
jgi:hypothetical protein